MIRIYENLSTKFSNTVNKTHINKTKSTIFSSLFTHKLCLLCNEALSNSQFFCAPCIGDLPKSTTKCAICCLPLPTEYSDTPCAGLICGECLTNPPSFTKTLCPFTYEFPIKQLIHQVKYSKQRYWLNALCEPLLHDYHLEAESHPQHTPPTPDLLVPIPIHTSKRKERSYNQAELMAYILSKNTGIRVSKNIMLKTKATTTQAKLNKQERLKNLRGTFSVSQKAVKKGILKERYIALIDDVMTTKATCELASKLLLENGARRVDVWCLARTPKFN